MDYTYMDTSPYEYDWYSNSGMPTSMGVNNENMWGNFPPQENIYPQSYSHPGTYSSYGMVRVCELCHGEYGDHVEDFCPMKKWSLRQITDFHRARGHPYLQTHSPEPYMNEPQQEYSWSDCNEIPSYQPVSSLELKLQNLMDIMKKSNDERIRLMKECNDKLTHHIEAIVVPKIPEWCVHSMEDEVEVSSSVPMLQVEDDIHDQGDEEVNEVKEIGLGEKIFGEIVPCFEKVEDEVQQNRSKEEQLEEEVHENLPIEGALSLIPLQSSPQHFEEQEWHKVEFAKDGIPCYYELKHIPIPIKEGYYLRNISLVERCFLWYRDGYSDHSF